MVSPEVGGPKFLVANRQMGKTTEALRWVHGGKKIKEYPGWDRALFVATPNVDVYLRSMSSTNGTWWEELDDWPHRVFCLGDLTSYPRGGHFRFTEVVIDELLLCARTNAPVLAGVLANYNVVGITASGSRWDIGENSAPPERPSWVGT